MTSEKVLQDIINGKKNILSPIFNGLAYIDVEITDKDNCLIKLGGDYYVKTKLEKAKEISKRINLEKAKNEHSISKLDENTFEIRENIASHEEAEKQKEKKEEMDSKDESKKLEEEKEKNDILEENRKLLEKIEEFKKSMKNRPRTKRLKLKKKEDIIDTVLKKLI